MRLRLSQPNETPSEEDDFDTLYHYGYVFTCQQKKGGSQLFKNKDTKEST
jgi:hypothetical protein